jgi:hypothetical protein
MSERRSPAWTPRVRFGSVDASSLVTNLSTTQSIDELAHAELELTLEPSFIKPIELFSEATIGAINDDGREELLFTGNVVDAAPSGNLVRMRLGSGVALQERTVSPMWSEGVAAPELIYTTARDAGLPDERLSIQGVDDLPEEVVEVTVPITGIELDSRVRIGNITFLPHSRGLASIAGVEVPELLAESVAATSAHAIFITRAARLLDAEKQALQEIDVVLSWLRVYAHYGLLWRPNGRAQAFTRERAHSHPQRGQVVVVRALESRRRWVRVPEDRTPRPDLRLDAEPLPPPFPSTLSQAERQALIACRRAAGERDPIAASTALSDAMEFYAAGVAAPALFEEAELEVIQQALPELPPHKKKVVVDSVKRLNSAPLKNRLLEATKRDSTPLSPEELAVLWKIRGARNDAVHGKGTEAPSDHEIAYATSLVARLLAFRIERRLTEAP